MFYFIGTINSIYTQYNKLRLLYLKRQSLLNYKTIKNTHNIN